MPLFCDAAAQPAKTEARAPMTNRATTVRRPPMSATLRGALRRFDMRPDVLT